ncbi:MAG TPA: DUF4175 family protein [Gemmatimonadaceae bacterium]
MTAIERVRRTQRILGVVAVTHALAWGLAATLLIVAAVSFVENRSAAPVIIAVMLGVAIASVLLWRARHLVSTSRVALWIEERIPDLQYTLVTAMEQSGSPFVDDMERAAALQDIGSATRVALRKALLAVAGLVAAALLLYVSGSDVGGTGGFARLGRMGASSNIPAASRLEDIHVVVTPPAYTGGRRLTLDDPSSITTLTGSSVAISGHGSASGLTASISVPVRISGTKGSWTTSFQMPARPAALTLKDRNYERVIVLDPRADAPPKISLTSPIRDTTLRKAQLVVHLNATATDDIGLSAGHFEYLITSGSGEIFTGRTITTPLVSFGGSRNGSISATLDLASLKLGEGDIVSMRAIVQDGNTLTGPGVATSDTRTIRIARAGEYDSLAVDAAAPPPLDTSVVSQRMLILMAEKLVREQPQLAHEDLVKRSTEIGDLEDGIRKRVRDILSDGEESPVQQQAGDQAATVEEMESPDQINGTKDPDLAEAYKTLWESVRSLKIAEPALALPPMRAALKALDRARLANRLYLRGLPPRIMVDIQRVRLAGKQKGSPNTRTPRSFADSTRVRLSARFGALLDLIEKQPARAITELSLMRVDALSSLPDFAAALGEATDAIRAGKDATLPLLRARRALDGPPATTPGLPAWMGGE